jgi:chitin disaccharide deacetylase
MLPMPLHFKTFFILLTPLLVMVAGKASAQKKETYAQMLGWPKDAKVVIFHVDDAGMYLTANQGTIKSIEKGVATSCSIMMPCSWAASFTRYAMANPAMDAGLHLTLTSEWKDYRWAPLAGKNQVPGLTDKEGAMWPSVAEVVKHASPDEVETEIRAQVDRALTLGLKPTHLDSHMGTLFDSEAFMERYIKVGVEYGIPVMFPGGTNKLVTESLNNRVVKQLKAEGKWREGMKLPAPAQLKNAKAVGTMIWNAGLPVLDDLHTISGDWKPEGPQPVNAQDWGKYKVQKFKETLTSMEPGLAMIIVHSNDFSETFQHISSSGGSRYADMLAMMDPELKAFIQKEGIILTTWREVMERRQQANKSTRKVARD